jgi:cysteine-rich repeat protein
MKLTALASLASALASLVLTASAAHAQTTETYVFRDSLSPNEGAGNVLVPVHNGTGAILTSGEGFVGGSYVTHTISPSACASSPTVRAWSFPVSGGLRHANASPAIVTGSYSVSMLMRYSPMDTGYARLIDFSNSMQDTGIYKLNDGVSFYPVGTFAPGSFVEGQDVFVTITRNADTRLVSLYINDLPSGEYVDTGNLYAPVASVMYFLMDNTTGSAAITETDAGVISYLQVRSTPMTPAEVTASLAGICDTVACGDGRIEDGEECDDSGVLNADGCSSQCTVEPGFGCSGAPSVCMRLPDAGMADAGANDAGATPDAGTNDAGATPDAGAMRVDGGAADAGVRDASLGHDAAMPAGTSSRGCGCLVAGSMRTTRLAPASLVLLALVVARRCKRLR